MYNFFCRMKLILDVCDLVLLLVLGRFVISLFSGSILVFSLIDYSFFKIDSEPDKLILLSIDLNFKYKL